MFMEVGTRTLEEFLDERVCVLMRDGKYVYEKLTLYDQYHNLLMEYATEIAFNGRKLSERFYDL